jgi:hypothetical protein
MPGFSIFYGDLKTQIVLNNLLSNYENTTTLEIAGEPKDFLDKVNDFEIKSNGDISFQFQSDGIVRYTYRGEQKYYLTTYYNNIRIITGRNNLYYLIQRDKFDKSDHISSKLSRLVYESEREILPHEISSDLIKSIENRDSLAIRRVSFSDISARDRAVVLFGSLSRKQDDGSHDYSSVHDTFKNGVKSFSEFSSYSRGSRVLISGKQHSLTLMNLGDNRPNLDDAELYIKDYILI